MSQQDSDNILLSAAKDYAEDNPGFLEKIQSFFSNISFGGFDLGGFFSGIIAKIFGKDVGSDGDNNEHTSTLEEQAIVSLDAVASKVDSGRKAQIEGLISEIEAGTVNLEEQFSQYASQTAADLNGDASLLQAAVDSAFNARGGNSQIIAANLVKLAEQAQVITPASVDSSSPTSSFGAASPTTPQITQAQFEQLVAEARTELIGEILTEPTDEEFAQTKVDYLAGAQAAVTTGTLSQADYDALESKFATMDYNGFIMHQAENTIAREGFAEAEVPAELLAFVTERLDALDIDDPTGNVAKAIFLSADDLAATQIATKLGLGSAPAGAPPAPAGTTPVPGGS